MKKLLLALSIVFILSAFIILVMSCDDTIGLGDDPVPENLFAGGEWEQIINDSMPWFRVHRKLSFTVNTFALYEERQDSSITYTGTYSLFYEGEYHSTTKIKFTSDEPTLNGEISYSFAPIVYNGEQLYPDNSVTFFIDSSFPINGYYTPTNN